MSRPARNNVDYFPHECNHGRKMFIIEQKFGNDGYAGWFKLLEELGKANDHFIDLNDPTTELYLISILKLKPEIFKDLIETLSVLGAIEKNIWDEFKVIYSQKLVNSVTDAYKNRITKIVNLSSLYGKLSSLYGKKHTVLSITSLDNPQSKVKYSKVKNTKVINSGFDKPKTEQIFEYCQERKNSIDAEMFFDHYESNGWKVGKSNMKDWKASVRLWEKNQFNNQKEKIYGVQGFGRPL